MTTEPRIVYEFGPFRMDPIKQTLLRENNLIPLTPKAFETLLALVRHSRDVVSKEDLLKEVWPDSFVEESNLSQNIFLLRKALGDTAKDRQYIVTLPGRGYRFAAPVRTLTHPGDVIVAHARTHTHILIEENEVETAGVPVAFPPPQKPRASRKALFSIAAMVVLLIVGAFFLVRDRRPTNPGEKRSILVADFVNTTGDPIFDDTLRRGMEVQLEQSPSLSLISDQSIRQVLGLMRQPLDSRLQGQTAREVCERTGGSAVLEGSIKHFGSDYVLNLHSVNCRTGENIDDEQAQVTQKEDILAAVTKMARGFRARVGASTAPLVKQDTPLAEATTPSLEALKAYSLGWRVEALQGGEPAIPFFLRAVEIDPSFAMAYASLGLMYGSSGSSELATENVVRAYQLRDRASDKERFFITAYYFGRATGNQEKAQQVCNEWIRTYPLEFLPHAFLAGFVDLVLANYTGASEEARRVVQLNPDDGVGYYLLGYDSLYLNNLQDAETALHVAAQRNIDQARMATLRFDLAYIMGDRTGMRREVETAQAHPELEDRILDRQAFAEASEGHLKNAVNLSLHAVALALQGGRREQAAVFEVRAALWEAFFEESIEAKRTATEALTLAGNREVNYGAALALALAGELKQADTLANDLEKRYPEDTSVRFSYLPVIRAAVAVQHGDSSKAFAALQASVPYEMGSPRSSQTAYFGSLYPVFFSGEAFLAAHKGSEAAKEFEKILAHPGIMIGDPVFVLSHIGLARSYALAGEFAKARVQYEKFFALWKNADTDCPILKRAEAEYRNLR
ncbi:winged helix-turn-helix domain-containing protein [Tunturiibacter gelidoferens]|uniref:Winged helix-turn-helix domain-containing protein n=1 Tax=Tunturiibacter gelidiferens TaxID=3069689 RepID=A0AAU7YZM5_9BACT